MRPNIMNIIPEDPAIVIAKLWLLIMAFMLS